MGDRRNSQAISTPVTTYSTTTSTSPALDSGVDVTVLDLSGDDIVISAGDEPEQTLTADSIGMPLSSSPYAVVTRYLTALGISRLENVKVTHCSQAYGVRLWSTEGWSLVFSGDTRPCEALIELGRDATILIHEATFDNSKGEEAVQKKHSTVQEAYSVAERMNAFRLILTHFSQRYPTIPPFSKHDDAITTATDITTPIADIAPGVFMDSPLPVRGGLDAIFACDFMDISFPDLLWAPSTCAVMAAAFPVSVEEEEDELLQRAGVNGGLACSCSNSSSSNANPSTVGCAEIINCQWCLKKSQTSGLSGNDSKENSKKNKDGRSGPVLCSTINISTDIVPTDSKHKKQKLK